mgnify:CR=1 FL=1
MKQIEPERTLTRAELRGDPTASLQKIGAAGLVIVTRWGRLAHVGYAYNEEPLYNADSRILMNVRGVTRVSQEDFSRNPIGLITDVVDAERQLLVVESQPPIAFQGFATTALQDILSKVPIVDETDPDNLVPPDRIEQTVTDRLALD